MNFQSTLKSLVLAAGSAVLVSCAGGWVRPGDFVFGDGAGQSDAIESSAEPVAPPLKEVWVSRLTAVPQETFSATGDLLMTGSMDGRVTFIRIFDGKLLKSVKMEDRTEVTCSLSDGLWIACLRRGRRSVFAYRLRDGKRVWTADAGPVATGPLHSGATLFFGTSDKEALALNASTGAVFWRRNLGSGVCGIAAVSDDSILFAAENGRLFCLNGNGGTVFWSVRLPGDMNAGPAVLNGTAYAGTVNGWFCAIRCRDGRETWRFKSSGGIHLQAALDAEAVYFGTSRGVLHALDRMTGTERWRFETQGTVSTRPLPSGEWVYFGSTDKCLYAVGRKTGAEVWKTGLKGRIRSAPFVWRGMLFTGSEENNIYAFKPARDSKE